MLVNKIEKLYLLRQLKVLDSNERRCSEIGREPRNILHLKAISVPANVYTHFLTLDLKFLRMSK